MIEVYDVASGRTRAERMRSTTAIDSWMRPALA
jgi:hypothetical protein